MLRQYVVNHYIGTEAERPIQLPQGDFYFATDSTKLYKYDDNNYPVIVDGVSSRIIVTQQNKDITLGGIIDSTKVYHLDGIIDMGSTQITVPTTELDSQWFIEGR